MQFSGKVIVGTAAAVMAVSGIALIAAQSSSSNSAGDTSTAAAAADSSTQNTSSTGQTASASLTTASLDSDVIPHANCGAGSLPETGLQGQVPLADRNSGRSKQGYRCNLELVGRYQGEGGSWVNPFYRNCAYMATTLTGLLKRSPGVQVVDLSDPARPRFATRLTTASMLSPWESLKVNEKRGLLGGVSGGVAVGGAFFEVYDLNKGCAAPELQNGIGNLSIPANVLGHEGGWSPDGMTYWAAGFALGVLTAIDVSNPKLPTIVFVGSTGTFNHGFSFSKDGNRLYIASLNPAGIRIFDVSDIQRRAPVPTIRELGSVSWNSTGAAQMTIPVTWGGHPYLIAPDEFGTVRIIDISDETNPVIVRNLQLEIQLPANSTVASSDTKGTGLFAGYYSHYCTVDRRDEPTAIACGYFNSGIRVFGTTGPNDIREIAYYNPPAQTGKNVLLQGSEHANGVFGSSEYTAKLTAEWCTSPPRFVGSDQLWATCQDNGVQVLRFTNGVYRQPSNAGDPATQVRPSDD
ncbi:LVIVD repeat-containing protein [Sphingomonas sp. YR710]|uniref:LVIVD repeat-containing protein n=1 Tax=Sphingomonas sp. YR710 TaxID=1882773 RepID=UPI0008839600|nr:hypothetical protein [Sphingomonas sp. YR710]SDC12856.1 LVIVD repeat-containing protein [Sphingomonas sp. YR710]